MIQQAELEDGLAMSHNIASRAEYNRLVQVQPAAELTCQTNGRFLRLMIAKIKARVFHVASDPTADTRSRRLPAWSVDRTVDIWKV